MTVYTGYPNPTNNIIVRGDPFTEFANIGVAANMYPGRLVVREDTDVDIKVADGILPPVGWLGFEKANIAAQPASVDTIWTVDTEAPYHHGGHFVVRGRLARGFYAYMGDYLCSWSAGQVAPCAIVGGGIAIKVPFGKAAAQTDTYVDFVAGMIIKDCNIFVTTEHAADTIDVGMGMGTEAGFNVDGLVDGASVAAKGWVTQNLEDTTTGNVTRGELITEAKIKTADTSAIYYMPPALPGLVCDGTLISLDYTPSANDTIAGFIYVTVESPGVQIVGKCMGSVDATAAAANVFARSVI